MLKNPLSLQKEDPEIERLPSIEPFSRTLISRGLTLARDKTHTLQLNVGLVCNQKCRHCHLEAGPDRTENMQPDVLDEVAAYARRCRFETIDITGGAPELNPHIIDMVETLGPLAPRMMFRSNLSAINSRNKERLRETLKNHGAVIVASFPSLNLTQADAQRGDGIFKISISALKKLNQLGYGCDGSGLELNLVSNPSGAFLPPSQVQTEKRFRQVLKNKYGIVFNHLFGFANVPLGRFRKWLIDSGNLDAYMARLSSTFNSCAINNVMCKTMISVSWDGYLFDCDFNLSKRLYLGKRKIHVSEMATAPAVGDPIATAYHCYACTAGSGFT